MERLHPADRGPLARQSTDAAAEDRQVRLGAAGHGVPEDERRLQALRPPGARTTRAAPLARARGRLPQDVAVPRLVRHPQHRRDARHPPRARPGRDRGAPEWPAAMGSRGALVPGDREGASPGGRAHARRPAVPCPRGASDDARLGGPPRGDGRPRSRPRDVPLSLRPPDPRPRPRRGPLRLPLPAGDVRVEGEAREFGYYVLPILEGDRLVGRIEPRFDRASGVLEVLGAWGDTARADEALASLAAWLGAK